MPRNKYAGTEKSYQTKKMPTYKLNRSCFFLFSLFLRICYSLQGYITQNRCMTFKMHHQKFKLQVTC